MGFLGSAIVILVSAAGSDAGVQDAAVVANEPTKAVSGEPAEAKPDRRSILVERIVTIGDDWVSYETVEDSVERGQVPNGAVRLSERALNWIMFDADWSAATARARLEQELKEKIELADRICGLTDAQREKLQLTGKGDMVRLFEQIDGLRDAARAPIGREALEDTVIKLHHRAKRVREFVGNPDPFHQRVDLFGYGSLFAKVLSGMVPFEQYVKFKRSEVFPSFHKPAAQSRPVDRRD